MYGIALKMLMGEKGRFYALLLGIFFAALVITQQGAIFSGLMSRTYGFLNDTQLPDLWVMNEKVQFIDDVKPLSNNELFRVRGVEGIEWAVPLYKGLLKARLANGLFQSTNIIGVDDTTMIGAPPIMVEGNLSDLRKADGVIVDEVGARGKLARVRADGSREPLRIGDTLELNDKRAIVVGFAKLTRTFQSQPVIYTTYSRAISFAPRERRLLSFVLVKGKPGEDLDLLKKRIRRDTGLSAYTNEEFSWITIRYYMKSTGIPINFGIAIALAFIIGAAIAGQNFYSFTVDNIRYFGTLKAMGASNWLLTRMLVLQATVVGLLGYGLGVGAASFTGYISKNSELAFKLPWQLLLLTGSFILIICILAAFLSIRKVVHTDPAIVFKQ